MNRKLVVNDLTFKGVLLLAIMSLGLLVGGCSWFAWLPGVGDGGSKDDEESSEPIKLEKFIAEADVRVIWKRGVGQGLGKKYVRLIPSVVADRIVAADAYGGVFAFDRFNGKKIWANQFDPKNKKGFGVRALLDRKDPSFVSGGVSTGDGLIFLGTTKGEIVALNLTDGTESWRTQVGTEIGSSPAVGDGEVFVHTIDDRLSALDVSDGRVIWTADNQMPLLTLRGTASPTYAQGVVFSGTAGGKIAALRGENGEPIWEQRLVLPEGRSELDRMVDVDASPLVSGSIVYGLAYQGNLVAFNRRDGRPLWQVQLSGFQDMAEGYGQIYVVDESDKILALDKETGEISWESESFLRRELTAPVAYSNYLVVGDGEGYLHFLAQRDGRMIARRKIDGDGIRTKVTVAGDTVFVLANSGNLYALSLRLK